MEARGSLTPYIQQISYSVLTSWPVLCWGKLNGEVFGQRIKLPNNTKFVRVELADMQEAHSCTHIFKVMCPYPQLAKQPNAYHGVFLRPWSEHQ